MDEAHLERAPEGGVGIAKSSTDSRGECEELGGGNQ
jgi:hypothetical protein